MTIHSNILALCNSTPQGPPVIEFEVTTMRPPGQFFRRGLQIAQRETRKRPLQQRRHFLPGTHLACLCQVALEISGYWTPEYLAEKFAKLGRVRSPRLLVAVPQARALEHGALPHAVLPFKTRILLRELLAHLEELRRRPAAGVSEPAP